MTDPFERRDCRFVVVSRGWLDSVPSFEALPKRGLEVTSSVQAGHLSLSVAANHLTFDAGSLLRLQKRVSGVAYVEPQASLPESGGGVALVTSADIRSTCSGCSVQYYDDALGSLLIFDLGSCSSETGVASLAEGAHDSKFTCERASLHLSNRYSNQPLFDAPLSSQSEFVSFFIGQNCSGSFASGLRTTASLQCGLISITCYRDVIDLLTVRTERKNR